MTGGGAAAMTPFAARLAEAESRHGARPYLICGERAWTFSEAAARSRRAAALLGRHGARPGDRIGTLMGNDPAHLWAIFGAWLLGAAAVPLSPALAPRELTYQLAHAAPRLVVASSDAAARHAATIAGSGVPCLDVADDFGCGGGPADASGPPAAAAAAGAPAAAPGPDAEALIIYTSGSSGRPKGVVLTSGNVLANADSIARWYGFGPGDRLLTVLPLSFINPLVVSSLAPLLAGASTVLSGEFGPFGLARYWGLVDEHGVNVLSAVPSIYAGLLRLESGRGRDAARRARLALCGGAHPPATLVTAFAERFGLHIADNYGLTETTCWATMAPPDPARRRPGSAGVAVDCEVRVVDDQGRALGAGGEGEVVVGGANVSPGYHRDPALTAARLRGGWFFTGDLGRLDADGCLYIHGRHDDMIIRRGVNIYPREIDDVLLAHPQVAEARTVGVASDIDGQEVISYVTLKGLQGAQDPQGAQDRRGAPAVATTTAAMSATAADITRFCRSQLAPYRWPREVRIVERLPTTPSGKVAARLLQEGYHD